MVFSSFVFLFFFLPLVLFLYHVVCRGNIELQNILLMFASLFFYSYGEPTFVFVMLFCVVINWLFGMACIKITDNKILSVIFALTIIANLLTLGYYKYAGFIVDNLNRLGIFNFAVPIITLPIGISFFTFQAMSYTIDVFKKRVQPQRKLSNLALYVSLFPQLVAGPIVRYKDIEKSIANRKISLDDFYYGMKRFVYGLGKKVLIANVIVDVVNFTHISPPPMLETLSITSAWLGSVAYTLQIYFDFSGYSDMAIGLGLMFGFRFNENFNLPYISRSVSDFWRRWHISLSTWFRDYVYFPLGGSRVGSKTSLIFNLFIVWLLTGVWHGASWRFIVWGLMYFVLISFEKLTGFDKRIERLAVLGNLYTMFFVVIGWTIFSVDSKYLISYLRAMFGLSGNILFDGVSQFLVREYWVTWILGGLISTGAFQCVKKHITTKENVVIVEIIELIIALGILVLSLVFIAGSKYNPFIYFNF